MTDSIRFHALTCGVDGSTDQELDKILGAPVATLQQRCAEKRIDGVRIGTVVGFTDGGATPLVIYADQPDTAAQPARATLELHAAHIGKSIVLMFEEGDPGRPIIVGCLRGMDTSAVLPPQHVEVEADGRRLVVSAKDRIVLRCGKASITLTREGKLILQGEYVSNQSSGVLRLKGGSVQIN